MVKKIILGTILFLVVISLVKDKIIEVSAENICTRVIGVRLDIDSLKVGLVRPVISIKDMKLYNPNGRRSFRTGLYLKRISTGVQTNESTRNIRAALPVRKVPSRMMSGPRLPCQKSHKSKATRGRLC